MSEADIFKDESMMVTGETQSGEFLIAKLQNMPSVTTLITECSECQEEFSNPVLIVEIDKQYHDPDFESDESEIENNKKYLICNDCKEVLAENT